MKRKLVRFNWLMFAAVFAAIALTSPEARSQKYEGCYTTRQGNFIDLDRLCPNSGDATLPPPPSLPTLSSPSNTPTPTPPSSAPNAAVAAQCNQLTAILDANTNRLGEIEGGENDLSPALLSAIAQSLNISAQTLDGLQLSDPVLQSYRLQFSQSYKQGSQAAQAMATAYQAQDSAAAAAEFQKLMLASGVEEQLAEQLNSYCAIAAGDSR